jgi:hypothetical protein
MAAQTRSRGFKSGFRACLVKARVRRACRPRRIRRTYLWLTSLGALPKLRTLLCKKQPAVPIVKAGLALEYLGGESNT